MSIKTFISEFQDYLFVRRAYIQQLSENSLSASSIELAFKQTEELLEDFKINVDFLEKEGGSIESELITMFNSLENKIDKINRMASAIIGINATEESSKDILTINPYEFSQTSDSWENVQKCYILPARSSHTSVKPYSNEWDANSGKGLAKFVIDSSFSTRYINILKNTGTSVDSLTYYNNSRDEVGSETFTDNLGKSTMVVTTPSTVSVVLIEYRASAKDLFIVTPLAYHHEPFTTISLGTAEYKLGTQFSLLTKAEVPYGCYAQIKFDVLFKDINGKVVTKESFYHSIDNDGKVVLNKEYLTGSESVLGIWLQGVYKDVTDVEKIPDGVMVVTRPKFDGSITRVTESIYGTTNKKANSLSISASLQLFSLLSDTSTPRIFSITGLTKNA